MLIYLEYTLKECIFSSFYFIAIARFRNLKFLTKNCHCAWHDHPKIFLKKKSTLKRLDLKKCLVLLGKALTKFRTFFGFSDLFRFKGFVLNKKIECMDNQGNCKSLFLVIWWFILKLSVDFFFFFYLIIIINKGRI